MKVRDLMGCLIKDEAITISIQKKDENDMICELYNDNKMFNRLEDYQSYDIHFIKVENKTLFIIV